MHTYPTNSSATGGLGTPLAGERRVGDAERQRAVDLLGSAFTQGYLDLPEYEARLPRAFEASTAHALGELLDDLPVAQIRHRDPQRRARRAAFARRGVQIHAGMYVAMAAICVAIWAVVAVSCGEWYFWPIWPILGAGVGLAGHAIPVLRGSRTPMATSAVNAFMPCRPMQAFRSM